MFKLIDDFHSGKGKKVTDYRKIACLFSIADLAGYSEGKFDDLYGSRSLI